ncbi:hypothetical protein MIND_00905300 [Mycena indigotica]|uniref:Uncharacterized protein n=1 Tax=Mycena indigotica TaxID=2126181 RepID=A0A8H6VWT0_9AGAR|nr:uncharacterized protein MIND_00905300 [Mycena indigotica]KAF7296747.1 hypothetical protein MIND_00905300 [Mycena indigotica]
MGRFPNLTAMILSTPGGFDADDNALSGFLAQVPQLARLCLVQPNVGSKFTLYALVIAAQHSALRYLELTMDGGTGPLPALAESSPSFPSVLRELYVGHTRIRDPAPMANFLHTLFPALDNIEHQWLDEIEEYNVAPDDIAAALNAQFFAGRWDEVAQLMEDMWEERSAEESDQSTE